MLPKLVNLVKLFEELEDKTYKSKIEANLFKKYGKSPTYGSLTRMMLLFKDLEFIRTEKLGRIQLIYLTEKGNKMKKLLNEINNLMDVL